MLAFLGDRNSFPHGPESVRLLQTHASYVAIASPFVYKIKKPVDFGFLDFSTLDKRKFYCEEEVRLNSRMSSDVYLEIVPIYRTSGGLSFSGTGDPSEYAVKMRQLDDRWFMKRMLEEGSVDKEQIDRIVEVLCDFYTGQSSTPEVAEWGRIRRLRITTDENFDQTEAYTGDLISRPAFSTIKSYTDRFYAANTRLFNRRRAEGFILDCHGDLHLEHIHLEPGKLTIYDCIEFNKRLRFLDIANDVAFLSMDLDVHEEHSLASYFAEKISVELRDPDLPALLDFYKCYRAYVRAKVNSFRSASGEIPEEERDVSRSAARRYYSLSLQYALAGSTPMVIIVMGNVGTGKSRHAHRLGEALGWPVYSSDAIRKKSAGLPLFERSGIDKRGELYTRERTEEVYGALADAAVKHGAKGVGCVLDATYGDPGHRDRLRARTKNAGLRHCFVELQSPVDEVKQRLEARSDADDVVSDARAEDLPMLLEKYEAPDPLEDVFHFTVSTEPDREAVSEEIMQMLSRLMNG